MATNQREPSTASFALVRRGFDPEQVTERLDQLDAEIQVLAGARDAAMDHATQLSEQLDTAHAEVARLRSELRVMSSPADGVGSMSERLQVMLRLVENEFGEMRGTVQSEIDDLCSLRERLARQIDASRELLDRALPDTQPPARSSDKHDGHRPPQTPSLNATPVRGALAK